MNIDNLLLPISPDEPCGEDMSFSLEFDAILEKRREDDPSLDQGEWVRALKVADWPGVVSQCEELLGKRTKDLRVASWLTDALARTRGFAGLADGLELCGRLCENHWDGVHPQADDGNLEQRVGSLAWLLGQVAELSRLAPVVVSGAKRHGLRDIEAARALQQAIARGSVDAATVAADGMLTLDEVARVQAATSRDFLVSNLEDVKRGLDALRRLQQCVDAHLGADGPGFGAARKALEDALGSVERFARDGGASEALAGAGPGAADAVDSAGATGGDAAANGRLQTRAQALRQLRAVAEFFRRTEPHSPVAYLADKAAKWGEMPLHAWLRVVLKDPSALAHVEELLGVDPPPSTT